MVGEAQGSLARQRVWELAQHGSREALAAALTPFGRSLLIARGVTGRDLEETLETVRRYGAATAIERGETPREILSSSILGQLDALGAAKGAAGSFVLVVAQRGEA